MKIIRPFEGYDFILKTTWLYNFTCIDGKIIEKKIWEKTLSSLQVHQAFQAVFKTNEDGISNFVLPDSKYPVVVDFIEPTDMEQIDIFAQPYSKSISKFIPKDLYEKTENNLLFRMVVVSCPIYKRQIVLFFIHHLICDGRQTFRIFNSILNHAIHDTCISPDEFDGHLSFASPRWKWFVDREDQLLDYLKDLKDKYKDIWTECKDPSVVPSYLPPHSDKLPNLVCGFGHFPMESLHKKVKDHSISYQGLVLAINTFVNSVFWGKEDLKGKHSAMVSVDMRALSSFIIPKDFHKHTFLSGSGACFPTIDIADSEDISLWDVAKLWTEACSKRCLTQEPIFHSLICTLISTKPSAFDLSYLSLLPKDQTIMASNLGRIEFSIDSDEVSMLNGECFMGALVDPASIPPSSPGKMNLHLYSIGDKVCFNLTLPSSQEDKLDECIAFIKKLLERF
ncbi:hypothetical protein ADUPG1_011992 [Aduncisulcus paluster]|uniref:Condensation domain-containing protein n=1 Tax=Aduncisulcus paluster TaxID=2918883 RepID=A0ABQ5JYM8_9EUKA|nr:hypothetical protein ADUPG1_011992 [Aduncisulcus paluster]